MWSLSFFSIYSHRNQKIKIKCQIRLEAMTSVLQKSLITEPPRVSMGNKSLRTLADDWFVVSVSRHKTKQYWHQDKTCKQLSFDKCPKRTFDFHYSSSLIR